MSRGTTVFGLACLVGAATACAPKVMAPAVSPAPQASVARPSETLVVLMPNADTGVTGRAIVKGDIASVELSDAFEFTVVQRTAAPEPVARFDEAEFDHAFGAALAALPPAPQTFTLYFLFESDQLTDASRELLPDVLGSVQRYPAPVVTAIGHTDSSGSRATNFALGRQRAEVVKELLVEIGIDTSSIEVVSHGETDPLVPTADGVLEPRNRRVDVVVR